MSEFIQHLCLLYMFRTSPQERREIGEKALALAQFDWDTNTHRMTYAGYDIPYGQIAVKPQIDMENAHPIRLYSLSELEDIKSRL